MQNPEDLHPNRKPPAKPIIYGPVTMVFLSNSGCYTIIDTKDLVEVADLHWYEVNGYAQRTEPYATAPRGRVTVKLHNLLVGLASFETHEVHHKNGNTLDNRRSNLEVLTFRDHILTRTRQSNNKSGFIGISWKNPRGTKKGKWVAQIGRPRQHIGYFKTAEEAARAYDLAAVKRWGNKAILNFSNANDCSKSISVD